MTKFTLSVWIGDSSVIRETHNTKVKKRRKLEHINISFKLMHQGVYRKQSGIHQSPSHCISDMLIQKELEDWKKYSQTI